ncbi:MAG: WGR domain-containing protein [Bradymonadaceae bacterium]|nr:WGR domain-containing protein [Lujinxingiaceae bacterium]
MVGCQPLGAAIALTFHEILDYLRAELLEIYRLSALNPRFERPTCEGRMRRRFTYSDAKSNKFWEVEHVEGEATFATYWGRIGTNGQSKTQTVASAAAAKADVAKLVMKKVRKDYVEDASAATAPVAAPVAAPVVVAPVVVAPVVVAPVVVAPVVVAPAAVKVAPAAPKVVAVVPPAAPVAVQQPEHVGRRRTLTQDWYDWERTSLKLEYEVFEDDPRTKDGSWKSYHRTGQLKGERLYSEGRLMEVLSCLDVDGNPLERGTLAGGEGTLKGYHENGALQFEGQYHQGLATGTWTYFHDDGSLNGGGEYRSGEQFGEFQWWGKEGNLYQRGIYAEDGAQLFHYKAGRLTSEGHGLILQDNFVKHGVWKHYGDDGSLTKRVEYDLGAEFALEAPDTTALLKAYRGSSDPIAQMCAMLAAKYAEYREYHHNPRELVAALKQAVADGDMVLNPELAIRLYVKMAENYVLQMLPVLELIDGEPAEIRAILEARLDAIAKGKSPNGNQISALVLAL